MCLIRANFTIGVKRVWGDVMEMLAKPLLHEAAYTISLCTWVRDECDLDVGTFNW